jgi:hypothetical protein
MLSYFQHLPDHHTMKSALDLFIRDLFLYFQANGSQYPTQSVGVDGSGQIVAKPVIRDRHKVADEDTKAKPAFRQAGGEGGRLPTFAPQ